MESLMSLLRTITICIAAVLGLTALLYYTMACNCINGQCKSLNGAEKTACIEACGNALRVDLESALNQLRQISPP